jgi:predicted RNA-binding Zn-ribbon protein involved in translation (DUF1610 family)
MSGEVRLKYGVSHEKHMNFKCHGCGKLYLRVGTCCGKALEKACPTCGFGMDFCTCETKSTKEGRKR